MRTSCTRRSHSSPLYDWRLPKIVTNLDEAHNLGLLGHTWSLAVEEQFYLLWPPLLILLLRKAQARIPLIIATLLLVSVTIRAFFIVEGAQPGAYRVYDGTDVRADALLMGCLLAVLLAWDRVKVGPGVVSGALCALLPVGIYMWAFGKADSAFFYMGGFTLDALVIGLLILHIRLSPTGIASRLLAVRPLRIVGVVSYGVYLWHWPIYQLLPAQWSDWPLQLLRFALIALCVLVSYRYVERPFLRMKALLAGAAGKQPPQGETAGAVLETS